MHRGTCYGSIYVSQNGILTCATRTQIILGHPQGLNTRAWAGVAQLVERKALNLVVKGSSPFFGGCRFVLRTPFR